MLRTAERVQLPRPRQSRIDLDQRTQSESDATWPPVRAEWPGETSASCRSFGRLSGAATGRRINQADRVKTLFRRIPARCKTG